MKARNATTAMVVTAALALAAAPYAEAEQGAAGAVQGAEQGRAPGAGQDGVHGSAATGDAAGGLSQQDQTFVREAASSNLMEVELGRLAASKAAGADVKRFGQHMTEDHRAATDRLKAAVSGKGVELPQELNAVHRAAVEKLTGLSGAEFDRAYMDHMVTAHQKDVELFRQQSEQGSDAALRAFAEETLPKLREHLASAQQIEQRTDASAASD